MKLLMPTESGSIFKFANYYSNYDLMKPKNRDLFNRRKQYFG